MAHAEAYSSSNKHVPAKYGDVIVANKHLQLKLEQKSGIMDEQLKVDMRSFQKERTCLRSKLTSHLHNKRINGIAHDNSSMEDLHEECELDNQDSSWRVRSSSFGRYLDIRNTPNINSQDDPIDIKAVHGNSARSPVGNSPLDRPSLGNRRLLSRSLSMRTNTNSQASIGMEKYSLRKTLSVSPLIPRKATSSPSQSPSNSSLESSPCGSRENLSSAAGTRTAPKSRFFKPSYKSCEITSSHRRCLGDQRYCDEMTVYYEKFNRDAAKIPNKLSQRSDSDTFDCKVKRCVRDF